MTDQQLNRLEKVRRFRALHAPGDPFVMPNPWDLGSAKVLAALGARALATTSSGQGFTLGLGDGGLISRDMALEHAKQICDAVDLPVSGDLENGFGAAPATVAETVRLAAEAGLAGLCIEDIDLPSDAAYPLDLAVERIAAAAEAARDVDIVLVARTDGFLRKAYDEAEAIRRCTAFADAGAEALYAPLVSEETIRALCRIGPPVNVLAAGPILGRSVAEIGAMGAARISIGGSLARVTHRAIIDAGRAMLAGDLTPLANAAPASETEALLAKAVGGRDTSA